MIFLKQSTAYTAKIGPFIDDTDGKTAETGLTLSQADIRLSKNGGDIAQKNESTACSHDELGYYDCPLDATDTGTLGKLQLFVHESGALPVFHEFMVVTANVYDTLFSTDKLEVDVAQWLGQNCAAVTNNGVPEVDITHIAGAAVATGSAQLGVNVVQVEGSDATNQIRDSVVDDATRIDASALNALSAKAPSKSYLTGTANSDGDIQADEATGNFPGSVGSVAGAVGSVTGAVGSVTGNVGGNVSGSVGSVTGNVGGNVTGSVGSVAAGGITAASVATNAIDADALAADAVTEIQSGLALEATLTAIKGAGWTTETLVVLKGLVDDLETRLTADRAGKLDNLDTTISSRLATAGYTAPDNASIAAIKDKTDNLPTDPAGQSAVEAAITAGLATLNDLSGDDIRDIVVYGTITIQQALATIFDMIAGKQSDCNTATPDVYDAVTGTVKRLVLNLLDQYGNRNAATLTFTDLP